MISADDKQLRKRLKKLGDDAEVAQRRATRETVKRFKARAKRDIGKTINLPARRIGDSLKVRVNAEIGEFRVSYKPEPAHHYREWHYRSIVGNRGVTERASGKITRTSRVNRAYRFSRGLVVRFTKGEQALVFNDAFRTPKVGYGRVFIQRKGRDRYPLEPIVGPTPWEYVSGELARYHGFGRELYAERLDYWIERYAGKT